MQRFAGINFVFGGLPLPWKRIFFFYICELQYFNIDQHFLLAFYWASLSKNLTQRRLTLRREEFFELKFENLRKKRISQQNHISLFIRGPGGLDSLIKKMPKNLMTLPLEGSSSSNPSEFLQYLYYWKIVFFSIVLWFSVYL